MRSSYLAASLLFTLFPLALAAQNPPTAVAVKSTPTPRVSAAFEHEQKAWNAIKAQDIPAFERLVDGPFTYIDQNGIVAPWQSANTEALKNCTLSSFTTNDVQTLEPSAGIVILSFQAVLDQTCNGVKSPSPIYILSVWQRKGSSWKLIAHSETAAAVQK